MSTLASGQQYEITHGDWQAVVTEQGGTLRSLRHGGRDLVLPFAADAAPQGCQGQQLLPWPNRIRDGRYTFQGTPQQLALSEPDRHNAIHGLVNWRPWQLLEHGDSWLSQQVVVMAEPGWPGVLQATLTHRLDGDGLAVEVVARNIGRTPVPYGYAAHPYLVLDGTPIDAWEVTAPFSHQLEVDERLLPIAMAEVAGTDLDFTGGRLLGDATLDTAFTGVQPTQGRWSVTARHGEREVALWSEEPCGWLQVYTPDDRASLAVEPMTCGPDAFNEGPTHDGVLVIEPGHEVALRWGITGR